MSIKHKGSGLAQAFEILAKVGIIFESESVRDSFKIRDAHVEGDKVFISRPLIEEALASTPTLVAIPLLLLI